MQDLALADPSPAAQDANAFLMAIGEIVECSNLLLTSQERGTEVQNLKLTLGILALKVFRSGSEGLSGPRSASRFPLIKRLDNL